MSISQRLMRVEDDFLSAIAEGSVESFNDELWTPLAKEIEGAIQSSTLDRQTISLAHATSSRIAILAEIFHDLYVYNERLTSDVMGEVDAILSRLTISDNSSPSHPSRQLSNINLARPSAERGSSPVSDQQLLSPTPSLVSLSTADDTDEDITPAFIISRKRNASSLDFHSGDTRSGRMNKRLRASRTPSSEIGDIDQKYAVVSEYFDDPLLSSSLCPTSSIHHVQNVALDVNVTLEPEVQPICSAPSSRKRRLSDADAYPISKRPRRCLGGSRPHAVSDPFPVPSAPIVSNDWFEVNVSMPEAPSLSWRDVESSATLQTDFFSAWPSIGATVVDNSSRQIADIVGDVASQGTEYRDPQSIMWSSCEATTSCSLHNCDASVKLAAEIISTGFVIDPSPVSNPIELPILPNERPVSMHGSFPTKSAENVACMPVPSDIISSTALGSSPPVYELDSFDIATSKSLEADVISLYTTLDDVVLPPVSTACNGISGPEHDLFVDSPPTFAESMDSEEGWAQFLAALDQPPEIILPTPPPPYNPSKDVARLLGSLLQPVEDATIPPIECGQALLDKQKKLEELEAAKEAVRRLEVEVGITAS